MILTILISITIVLLYIKMRRTYKYWKNMNVIYLRPWPLFGYMAPSVLRLKAFPLILQKVYSVFPEQRYFGAFQFGTPVLFIRCPKLIQRILKDDFETFPDRRSIMDADLDPLWAKNLHAMPGGDQWHTLRSTLSSGLAGENLEKMFKSMKTCAKNFAYFFLERNGESVDLIDATSKLANDVIASAVFGVACDSLQNRRNEFYLTSKRMTEFNLLRLFKLFGYSVSPRLMKFFRFKVIEERTNRFYSEIVQKGCSKDNLVMFLAKSGIGNDNPVHLAEAVAQGIHFFFSGYETVSVGLSFLLYELAINSDIQLKLRKEIDSLMEGCKDVSYAQILDLEYLDMVVSESLRKWPPTVLIDRKSVRPFTIDSEKVWDTTTTFKENTLCLVPVFAIHRDKNYYPNPDEFIPERFSSSNLENIVPNTYIPFGFGPRNCIGSQFALLEIKTAVLYLVREFEIVSTPKTKNPIKLSRSGFQLSPAGGLWVGLKPRKASETL